MSLAESQLPTGSRRREQVHTAIDSTRIHLTHDETRCRTGRSLDAPAVEQEFRKPAMRTGWRVGCGAGARA